MEIERATTQHHMSHHHARPRGELEDFLDDEDVEDIDMFDHEDPQFCTEYVNLIFDYLREKEVSIFILIEKKLTPFRLRMLPLLLIWKNK